LRERVNRRTFAAAAVPAVATLVSGCSLGVLNALVPSSAYQAQTGIAYGRLPRQRLDVYTPQPRVRTAPVVVFFYGGNWESGERRNFRFVAEALTSRGFIAVIPDYRLYPEVRFPAFLQDSATAVQWTFANLARFGGDPQNVFLMGHSAGAYNAAMLALDSTYLRVRNVDVRRIRGLIGIAGPYDFLPLKGDVAKGVFGYPDTPVTTQPIHFVTRDAPPALLLTGEHDDTVDPGNTKRLAAALRASSVRVREIVYPDLGHRTILGAVARPLRSLGPVLDDIAAYVGQSLVRGTRSAAAVSR
jgi:acetyl esterase/lipase